MEDLFAQHGQIHLQLDCSFCRIGYRYLGKQSLQIERAAKRLKWGWNEGEAAARVRIRLLSADSGMQSEWQSLQLEGNEMNPADQGPYIQNVVSK
jgi:hypothetical protein